MVQVVLGLGSNKPFGDLSPLDLLHAVCIRLSDILKNMQLSSVYETGPLYVSGQPLFYNMVVTGKFAGTPFALLETLHLIEAECGRDREHEVRNGPRSMDIDIELFGEAIIASPELSVPHPRITERAFVLVPMLEILPFCTDSITGKPYADFLPEVSCQDIRRYSTVSLKQ
jgi:2-amino-4-hydroxy-6-hydroxymethyldihydropteridine diphosphokinase